MPNLSQEVVHAAQSAAEKYSVPASVTLAQYGVESGWGTHVPRGSNNPFGIKAAAGQPFVASRTREVEGGKTVYITAKFRKFLTIADAFEAHAILLATKSIYHPAIAAWEAGDLARGIKAMALHYATDPHYSDSLLKIIHDDKLTQYDVPHPAAAAAAVATAFPELGAKKNEVVAQVQRRLRELGYTEVGNVDGNFGDITEKAILIFQADVPMALTGTITADLLVALTTAQARKLPEARTEATPVQVRDKVPEAKTTWFTKMGAGLAGVGTAGVAAVNWLISSFGDARNAIEPITDMLGEVPAWAWIGLLAAGFGSVWYMTHRAGKQITNAYQEGSRR